MRAPASVSGSCAGTLPVRSSSRRIPRTGFGALEDDADRLTMRIVDTAGESPFSLPLARR